MKFVKAVFGSIGLLGGLAIVGLVFYRLISEDQNGTEFIRLTVGAMVGSCFAGWGYFTIWNVGLGEAGDKDLLRSGQVYELLAYHKERKGEEERCLCLLRHSGGRIFTCALPTEPPAVFVWNDEKIGEYPASMRSAVES